MAKKRKPIILSDALVLHRYLLHLLGVNKLEALSEFLKGSYLEGFDENNVSKLYHELVVRLFGSGQLSRDELFEYDQHIVSHTLAISERREQPVHWKYFQYLGLLFTEIYLDRYFRDKQGLLEDLNLFVDKFNDPLTREVPNEVAYLAPYFREEELNKIAFWQATGSGKTLLMHVNILQFKHYANKYGSTADINRVLLVTPNEGLTNQHVEEFKKSGISAAVFRKEKGNADMFRGTQVEVIEITKLADESGDKTEAVEAFEENNLVLIDEGHRGVAGDDWKRRRDILSRAGFAFEYSATFGQAVSAATGKKRQELLEEYGKSIHFDYSYRYFYHDGYGKDYQILNIKEDSNQEFVQKYLTGSLLAFYQQQLIFRDNPNAADHYKLEKPLWIFVGSSVNAVRTENKRETSDVIAIIRFFTTFVKNPQLTKDRLTQILEGRDGLLDTNNLSIFANAFEYIQKKSWSVDSLYLNILETVFNTANVGANVYLDNLKGIDGELGLRLGDADDYFGVVNVGDDAKLHKLCLSLGVEGVEREFASSLFQGINERDSRINVLIGSKKFTEGWSSWRVSTMGLMNMGKGEGSQIIQLFGRGVRLKGFGYSLKRSSKLDEYQMPVEAIPAFIRRLETLNIFGIRADYMQQFKQLLEEEGLPVNDGKFVSISLPVMPTVNLDDHKLKIVKVQDGIDFKKDQTVTLELNRFYDRPPVTLDWYPKIQMLQSNRASANMVMEAIETHPLTARNLAFINWQEVWFELQRFKNERTWYNLSIPRASLQLIMADTSWYELRIPEEALEPKSFKQVKVWQDIVVALLKNYVDRYYSYEKQKYLSQFLEVKTLASNDPNFIQEYEFWIEQSQESIIRKLTLLKQRIEERQMPEEERIGQEFTVFQFLQHLYKPLVYIDTGKYREIVKIQPVALNAGEEQFVKDLKTYFEQHPDFFETRELFLLRNMSRKGVGFFEANNFYPDFILWLVEGEQQYVAFIDPKGLKMLDGFDNPKIKFHKTVKAVIEPRLNDPNLSLSSFIVTPTSHLKVRFWEADEPMEYFNQHNIYFQMEQRGFYVGALLRKMVGAW